MPLREASAILIAYLPNKPSEKRDLNNISLVSSKDDVKRVIIALYSLIK